MVTAVATIISSIITGLVAIYVCTVQNNKSMALIQYRMDQLEKKVETHNSLDSRLIKIETLLQLRHEEE